MYELDFILFIKRIVAHGLRYEVSWLIKNIYFYEFMSVLSTISIKITISDKVLLSLEQIHNSVLKGNRFSRQWEIVIKFHAYSTEKKSNITKITKKLFLF